MDENIVEEGYRVTAEFYDHVVPYREREDVPFFVEEARASDGPVLELGCGTGRVLIPTARAGVQIVGVDLSADMLAMCRERLKEEPREVRSRVELLERDMCSLDLGRSFELITAPFRSFQHALTVEAQIAVLERAYRHLEPGGRLILDVFNPDLPLLATLELGVEFGEEPEFTMADGRRIIRRHRMVEKDLHNQIVHGDLIYDVSYPDGSSRRFIQRYALRYLFRFEADHLLARCGYELETVYGGYDRSPYGSVYPGELIFVARRPTA